MTGVGQDCQRCPLKRKCWDVSRDPSPEVLVINLLVCRMKLGLKVNNSTKLLLRLLAPKLKSLAKFIRDRCSVLDEDELYGELQSACIEYILVDYKLGERAWVLQYLFAYPRGVMSGWALKYVTRSNSDKRTKQIRLSAHTDHGVGSSDFETELRNTNMIVTSGRIRSGPPDITAHVEDSDDTDIPVQSALRVVDDGVTLSSKEYRVMRFCLSHDDDGMHVWLADRMNVDRSSGVSRVLKKAAGKVVEVLGRTDAAVGYSVDVDPEGRRQRVLGLDQAPALTEAEEVAAVRFAKEAGPALASQAFGVHDRALYTLRRRHAEAKANESPTDCSDDVVDGIPAELDG